MSGKLRTYVFLVALATSAGLASQAIADDSDVTIGLALAKTSFMAQFDEPNANSAKMAIDDINKAGGLLGKKLKWEYADTKSDKAQAVIAANELIGKGAKLLLVSCDFDFGGPSASVANEKGILAFGCAGSPRFGRQGIGPNAFSFATETPDEGATIAEWAFMKQKWKTVYLLTDSTMDYTKTLTQYFSTRWNEMAPKGSIVGSDVFVNSDPSVATQITHIRGLPTKPDFILVTSCPPGLATAVRQMRAAGLNQPIVSGTCGNGDFWLPSVPGLKDFYNVVYVATSGDGPDKDVNEYLTRYQKLYGDPPQRVFGVVGYSEVQAYAKAVQKAGTFDTDAVRKALESFKNEPLLIGPTTFTEEQHGDIWRPMDMVKVSDGTHHFDTKWTIKSPPLPKF